MKRFFTILFSVAALVSATIFVSCSNDDSSSGGDDYYIGGGNETIILHAQYYNNIFIWESGINELDENENEMTAEYDGWYRFEIKSNSAGFIFFTDNWERKTEDLYATAGEWWFKDGNLYSYNPNSGSSSIPSAPQNVKTEATSSSSIKVSWDAVEDADSYSIYYRLSLEAGNESYERDGTETATTTTDTSVSIYGLTEWEIYLFWVTAKNSAGESHESDIELNYPCSATDPDENGSESGNSGTTTTTLSAPTGLTATAASSSSVELSWNSVSSATTYYVYKSEDSASSTASVISNTTSTSTTATGLKANTKYYFWVKAVNDTTMSDYSSYAYATTKAASSSSGGGSSTATNDLLSDITTFNVFTAPLINKGAIKLTDGKNGFYIPLLNSSEMNAEYYILYRSTTSKTDKSTYKKIKTVSRSSNIAFEDFDIDFTKNKTYYYVVVATSSKNDTYGTVSANALSIVLGNTRIKYTITTDNSKKDVYRFVSEDGSPADRIHYKAGGDKYCNSSLEPGYHSIKWCKTLNGSYMQIVSNYNFLPGCEYSISLDSGKISSSSPTLLSSTISYIAVP
ncbi:MAG: fibronectin type III domain-containing protein [Treponema sp.]|nr:fibronectin type III domain-containing protein [Treponema sp.]